MTRPSSPPASPTHPSPAQLTAFGHGYCEDSEAAAIEQHVLRCDQCCRKLAELPNDSLLDQLAIQPPLSDTDGDHNLTDTAPGPAPTRVVVADGHVEDMLAGHPKYELIRKLGAGGMGVVYQAFHRVMHRMVALKVISPRLLQDPDAKTRFRREVQIAARLNHPNVVAAFDADEIDGNLFLVSEYVDGVSLDQRIKQQPLAVEEACRIIRQVARGLAHAHKHGLIHRDIKPQNVLVSEQGDVKVVDFGLASYAEIEHADQQGITSAGVIVGTPDYISPEQIREVPLDPRADIYSLGCTLYFAIAGSPPFPEGSRVEKLAQHLSGSPGSLQSTRHDVPDSLDRCIARMMSKNPDERYQSVDEVITALNPFCSAEGHTSNLPPTITVVPKGSPRKDRSSRSDRRKVLAACGGLLATSLGIWGVRLLVTPDDTSFPLDRRYRILGIVPDQPLMRDIDRLYAACNELGLDYRMTLASDNPPVEGSSSVVPLGQVDAGQFETVVVFGTGSIEPPSLSSNPDSRRTSLQILQSMSHQQKPVGAFGAGIWTLGHLGLIQGKQVADCEHSTPAFKRDSGADWMDGKQVVVDGMLVTGSRSDDARPFLTHLLHLAASPAG